MTGPSEIGKSTLLCNAIDYILARKYFGGGVIMTDLRKIQTLNDLLNVLKDELIEADIITHERAMTTDKDESQRILVRFFN